MAAIQVVKTLQTKYAHLRGEYEHADRDIEDVYGLDAMDAAAARILKRKKEIHRQLDAIEIVIHIFDPAWDFASVKPIKPKHIEHKAGGIAQLACEVLRENNNVPMTVAEVTKAIMTKLGIARPDQLQWKRYTSLVTNTFMRRRDDAFIMLEGLPRRWMLRNYVPVPSAGASSNNLPKTATRDARPRRGIAG